MSTATIPAGPCALVIFGITGGLTRRPLTPSLYHLTAARPPPKEFAAAGLAAADNRNGRLRLPGL
jgi:glucose-6-phosphate 1-dehydrogenase